MKLQEDLREFIALLIFHNVEFLVVGGHAVAFHGYPRFTGDIDLFFDASKANAARLLVALENFGFKDTGLTPKSFFGAKKIFRFGLPPNRIDLLSEIDGVTFDEAWRSKVAATMDSLAVFFLSKDCLLKNKQASGRPKDLADIDELIRS